MHCSLCKWCPLCLNAHNYSKGHSVNCSLMLDSMEALGISTRLDVCTECWSSTEERRMMDSPGAFLFLLLRILTFLLLFMELRKTQGKCSSRRSQFLFFISLRMKRILDTNTYGLPWWSSALPMQGAQVWSLVKELDPTCCN